MSRAFAIGLTSAFITRIPELVFDPQLIATLQERLAAHGAQLQGQLPELLLRSNSPEEAIRSWLSDKDLSHWVPQAQGGSAAQGWQFETASWNRSRGAEPMTPLEVGRAHVDGGFDAIQAPGVAADLAGHCLEAAVIAAVITLGWELTRNRSAWLEATASARRDRLIKTLRSVGLASISGASLSLAVSLAIALIPGAQIWLMAGAICSAARALPGQRDQAFDLKSWIST
ncbi:hypothetical protein [Synechococcus sp. LA31]|uniref:hypothetical protein n=1 Tax=Synechococcus sp. LA31 TaxID=2741953 RepID=UPI001BDC6D8C|nr:hypothetical protein [Synechococcus sp. LA31]QVV67992.1 hypothetical protein KJJ24_02005 [Synechococcus sp. LA31]